MAPTLTLPTPNDASYDYVAIDGSAVQVGTNLLTVMTAQGEVTGIFDDIPPNWMYALELPNPDGTIEYGLAIYPHDPGGLPGEWWARMAVWIRAPKLADAETLTAGDGSKWIYPVGEDGRLRCYEPGTVHGRGDKLFRGQLTTDPQDIWVCDDAEWDWLPITDGAEVTVGDHIRFLLSASEDVDEISVFESEAYTRYQFVDTDSSALLGWWDDVHIPDPSTSFNLNAWSFFEKLPKPAAEAKFRAPDGSRWIYVGSSLYYCWGTGTRYVSGALFLRGEIAGGLTLIT